MKRHSPAIIVVVLFVTGLLVWLRTGGPPNMGSAAKIKESPSATRNDSSPLKGTSATPLISPSKNEPAGRKEDQINAWYLTPISVYGKVVDEKGLPVSAANVAVGIADNPSGSGSTYAQTTNATGHFSLTGVRGIAFSVRAEKEGYYSTKQSRGHRNIITPVDSDLPEPSRDQPIVLVLRKRGETEPLAFASSRQINIPADGRPIRFDLVTGQTGRGQLEIQSNLGDSTQHRFEWRYQLAVAGGGLIEREKNEFEFAAPREGYKEAVEINMPADAERWSSSSEREYFVKLPDETFARFSIRFYAGARNFVVVESYLNPKPGSRNLEYDPNKRINK
jgi:hypothetical protein